MLQQQAKHQAKLQAKLIHRADRAARLPHPPALARTGQGRRDADSPPPVDSPPAFPLSTEEGRHQICWSAEQYEQLAGEAARHPLVGK